MAPVGRALERVCEAVAMLGVVLVAIVLVSSAVGDRTRPVATVRRVGLPRGHGIPAISRSCSSAARWRCFPSCRCASSSAQRAGRGFHQEPAAALPGDVRPRRQPAVSGADFALAVQLGHGTADKFGNHDTTMVLRIPEGWAYAAALASVWLLVIVTAYTVARSAMEIAREPRHRSAGRPGSIRAPCRISPPGSSVS